MFSGLPVRAPFTSRTMVAGPGWPRGGRGFALFRHKSGAPVITEPAAQGPAAAPGVCSGSAPQWGRGVRRGAGTRRGGSGPGPAPSTLRPPNRGVSLAFQRTRQIQIPPAARDAPAPQGRGRQEKFALGESQSVFHKAFMFYKRPGGGSSGNPLAALWEPSAPRAGPGRAVQPLRQPGSARSPGTRAAAPQTTPRLLLEGESR